MRRCLAPIVPNLIKLVSYDTIIKYKQTHSTITQLSNKIIKTEKL